MTAWVFDALAHGRPLLLDGGLGQELVARGVDPRGGLWSARALLTDPELVVGVHADFVAAGADVITTNSYATTRRRLGEHDLDASFEQLNHEAGRLACQARDESGRDVAVAGSLPPIHGSYRPDPSVTPSTPKPGCRAARRSWAGAARSAPGISSACASCCLPVPRPAARAGTPTRPGSDRRSGR